MNKRIYSITLFVFSILILAAPKVYSAPVYFDANPDVYDPDNQGYAISGMSVEVAGSNLIVTIDGQYFQTWSSYDPSSLTALPIFSPGSLFLGVDGSWGYAVTFDGVVSNGAVAKFGDASLYSVDSNGINYGLLINEQMAWYTPQNGQSTLEDGTWALDATSLTVWIDLPDEMLDSIGKNGLSLSWTMKCGNAVVEGLYSPDGPNTPVPEPATLLLFGTGLLALAGVVRRRSR
ncbi:MAG: PEP-CTERM sorting domain-containing protein [Proteobacteria bacterium]|nr:PEP-CTERM sorting domain-containing protein [Pseudomonadota bacterium]